MMCPIKGFIYFILIVTSIGLSCSGSSKKDGSGVTKNTDPVRHADQVGAGKNIPVDTETHVKEVTAVSPDTVKGKWIRPDGNYLLDIRTIDAQNNLDAAYFNPDPVHISMAQIKKEEVVKLYIEFDDVNYRGSHYNLAYDPENDVLRGTYFLAAYGQTYQIAFVRYQEE